MLPQGLRYDEQHQQARVGGDERCPISCPYGARAWLIAHRFCECWPLGPPKPGPAPKNTREAKLVLARLHKRDIISTAPSVSLPGFHSQASHQDIMISFRFSFNCS